MSQPVCKVCGKEGPGILFSMFPKPAGFKFGDICTVCEERIVSEGGDENG